MRRQPSGLRTRFVEAGYFSSMRAGRTGRRTSSPPQFGQVPASTPSAQRRQKVHSKVQMRASVLSGGRSASQHSQFGRKSSMGAILADTSHRRQESTMNPCRMGPFALMTLCLLAGPSWAAAAEDSCTLETWRDCPDPLFVDPSSPRDLGLGKFRVVFDLIEDVTPHQSLQFVRVQIPAGSAPPGWHWHDYDAIVLPLEGRARFWWIDKASGEPESRLVDSAGEGFMLIPRGLAHFPDLRAVSDDVQVVEILLSTEPGWTAEDFLSHRVPVEKPIPEALPLD